MHYSYSEWIDMIYALMPLLFWPYVLFLFFLAYVTVSRAQAEGRFEDANVYFRVGAWVTIGLGGVIDVGFNLTFGTLIFWELPERNRLTFTRRCSKWMSAGGWRGRVALSFCRNLSVFQENHCHS